jgi:hypothetical protein
MGVGWAEADSAREAVDRLFVILIAEFSAMMIAAYAALRDNPHWD